MLERDVGGHAVVAGAEEMDVAGGTEDAPGRERSGAGEPQSTGAGHVPGVGLAAEDERIETRIGHGRDGAGSSIGNHDAYGS